MRILLKTAKKRWFLFVCCAVLIAGLLTGCGSFGGDGGFGSADGSGGSNADPSGGKASETARTIVVQETNGTTIVLDEAKVETNAYRGMHLVSGNDVTVQKISDLTMLLDMDKYLYAEESTHFWLEATGSQEISQTTIYLDEGAELNRIVNPLEEGSVYQVNTPNSTMAVRGTVFRVEVRKGRDNKIYTYLAVLDGSVKVKLKTTEGEYNGVEETIEAGQAAAIRADEEISEFIVDENGSITTPIDYTSFPVGTLEKILVYIDDGDQIEIDREELEKLIEEAKAPEEEKAEEHEHDWQTVTLRQADCTHEGLVQVVCSICGETKAQETIPVTAHTEAAQWTTQKEATCTEAGLQVKTCTVCGEVLKSRQTALKAHQPGEAQTVNATCTEDGSVTVSCLVCGQMLEKHIIEALGHQPGEWVVVQPADYGVEGSQSLFCTVCGQLLDTQSIPALIMDSVPPVTQSCTHVVEEWIETPASCTDAGSRTGVCTLCNEEVTEIIPALEHAWGDWVTTKEATCTEAGSRTRSCTREGCDETETETIDALGHSLTKTEAKAATCTAPGNNAYWTCSECGKVYSDAEGKNETTVKAQIIGELGHDDGEWSTITPATCTDEGLETLLCTRCGAELDSRPIGPLGHEYEWIVTTEPTCTAAGWEVYKCTRCNDVKEERIINALNHTEGTWQWDEALQKWVKRCTVCNTVLAISSIDPNASRDDSGTNPNPEQDSEGTA